MKEISEFIINSHDEDGYGNVRPSCVLRYMQECANLQLNHTHPTSEELKEKHQAFVISKMDVKMYERLHKFDRITVTSWLKECHGVTYNRLYRIHRGQTLVAEGNSIWAMIDILDGRILRVSEWDNTAHLDSDTVDIQTPRHFRMPKDLEFEYVGDKSVRFADIDSNCHMNNTNYPDMYCGFIPEITYRKGKEEPDGEIGEFLINYHKEAPQGDTLKIYRAYRDGAYYFRTVRDDGEINTDAVFTLKDKETAEGMGGNDEK